jgi:glycosyltransferase involved in cell wall biosynthesis
MQVVYLLTYLDNQTGGMERQALQLACRLRARGHEIFFVTCAHWSDMRKNKLAIRGAMKDFRVFRIPLISGWRRMNAVFFLLASVVLLIMLRRRYTVIHAHQLYTSGVIAAVVKFFLRSKRIIVKNCCGGLFGDVLMLERVLHWVPLRMKAIALMETVIAISEETRSEMEYAGFTQIILLPNGVDTTIFRPRYQDRQSMKQMLRPQHSNKKWVLFVGKFDEQKNIFALLRAFEHMSIDSVLLLVGKGGLENKIRHFIKNKNLEERVVLCGTTDAIEQYYSAADAFVLPSHAEGMSNALLEAMSSGLACIGADIASIRSVLYDDHIGCVYGASDDDEALSRALAQILIDIKKRDSMGRAARQHIEASFSIDAISARYDTLYG